MFHVKDTADQKKWTSSHARNEEGTHHHEYMRFLKPHSPWKKLDLIYLKGWQVHTFVRKEFKPQSPHTSRSRNEHSA